MEENIKKLEQSLLTELYGHDTVIVNKQALENLIKGYRELEKKNESLKEEKHYAIEEINYLQEEKWEDFQYFVDILSKTIPKSKIKEKIEELDKRYKEIESKYTEEEIDAGDENLDDYVEMQSIQKADEVLQELMEGK